MRSKSLVLPLALALAMAGCASTPRSDMLAADAPRALPEAGPVSVRWNDPATFAELRNSHNRYEAVTTELQEGVMKTRMQPIGNVWAKFPRIVRDIYPPRMTVQFRHLGADGRVIAEGERKLTDPAFLIGATPIDSSDPLRFEKRMIDSWLRRELVTAAR